MSGHSKWHTIKHKKAAIDAKRGRIFNKQARLIEVAARSGGPDLSTNIRLRAAVQAARDISMPKDKIDKAIAKGSGQVEGARYEEIVYEAYGPAGVALMLDVLTDNKNRTVGEIRHILMRHAGRLGEGGSVAWIFSQKGVISVPSAGNDGDSLLEIALEAGAQDISDEGETFEITTDPKSFSAVREALEKAGVTVQHAELARVASTAVRLEENDARKVLKLMEALEDHDDVQSVSANFDIPDEVLAAIKDEG
ncbi:MAG: YebC/PmpR family DNA-binding transcriptional regulator [Candidatus Eisenbacteria bacterium]|nr:YebC/PmpR family DNA-binding transcriptional regulator [Candidatus Eisenbacteria bacterium]